MTRGPELASSAEEPRRRPSRATLLVLAGVVVAAAALGAPAARWLGAGAAPMSQRVVDEAGLLPAGVRENTERYAEWIFDESGVDVRVHLARGAGPTRLARLDPALVRDLGDAGAAPARRGLVIAHDASTGAGRIEVGDDLRSTFPGALVTYLVRSHLDGLGASGAPAQGLHLLLRRVHHRIRQAELGRPFDPRVLALVARPAPEPPRARFGAQPSPEAAYQAYLDWLSAGRFDPSVELFTDETRRQLARQPLTSGDLADLLFQEFGEEYRIAEKGDRALLAFTSTPLVAPHFFVRHGERWQMDLRAEAANTAPLTGGAYTWTYSGSDDPYSIAFAGDLYEVDGVQRLLGGDNRTLPGRRRYAAR